MRIFKRILVILGLCLSAHAWSVDYDGNNPFIDPTPGEITIMACTPVPHGRTATRQDYIDLIDCGFNLGTEGGDIAYYKRQFEAIGDLNFRYLIDNPALQTEKRKEYIDAFINSPYVAGWKYKDEPSYEDVKKIGAGYQQFCKEVPRQLVYINLSGQRNKLMTGPFTSYFAYLEYIQKYFKPEVWSFDFYPIYIKDGKFKVNYEVFYSNLEAVSEIAIKTKRPFWAYCESMVYATKSDSRPAATEEHLRFEAFSALAYGAQGIAYWTYGQRVSNSTETYLSALVNLDGKKTKSWYAAQKVNREIRKFNDVFYNCVVTAVRHTGDKLYEGTGKLTGTFGPCKMVRSGDAGVLVSLIENNGYTYVVIVSRDVEKKQKVTLELKPDSAILDITEKKIKEYNWRKDISFTLDKGGYKIFRVK